MKTILLTIIFFMLLNNSVTCLSDDAVDEDVVDEWDDIDIQQERQIEPYFLQKNNYRRKQKTVYSVVKTKHLKRKPASIPHRLVKKQQFNKSYTKSYQLKAYKSPLHNPILYQKIR